MISNGLILFREHGQKFEIGEIVEYHQDQFFKITGLEQEHDSWWYYTTEKLDFSEFEVAMLRIVYPDMKKVKYWMWVTQFNDKNTDR